VSSCRVVDVRARVLRASADLTDVDGATETPLVEVEDEAGRVGIGEADTASEAARAVVLTEDVYLWCRGLRNALLGADHVQTGALCDELDTATFLAGPSGIARHALAAVDIPLHDLAGKQLGRPVYHLLGGARRPYLTPYATCYAGPVGDRTLSECSPPPAISSPAHATSASARSRWRCSKPPRRRSSAGRRA
jgi:L-rhamnonate dehydratase